MAAVVLWFKIPCIIVIRCVNRSDRDLFGRPSAATANKQLHANSQLEKCMMKSRALPHAAQFFKKIEQAETVWLGFSVAWAVSSKLDVFCSSFHLFFWEKRSRIERRGDDTSPPLHSWIGTKYRLMVRCHRMLDTKGIKFEELVAKFDERGENTHKVVVSTYLKQTKIKSARWKVKTE